jgi:3-deoxy-manno-octulosonate cytidylyltransferase (CMP-KDO synthetase)
MKILGVIPARYGSSRFPGKPLADILGKPMIRRVYEQAKKCPLLDDLIIATDDERIASCARSFDGNVMMTPENLTSGTERCDFVVRNFPGGPDFDVIINIQGDEPFINPLQISQLAGCFLSEEVVIGTLVKMIMRQEELLDPNVVKVVFDDHFRALYFSRQPIPFLRGIEQPDWVNHARFFKHIGIYGYRTRTLESIAQLPGSLLEKAESLEQLRWLGNGYPIHVKETEYESVAIDTPGDLLKITNIS